MPYTLNGSLVEGLGEPRLHEGTLWVPLRKIGENLGGSADYETTNRVPILYLNDHIVTLKPGDATIDLDGQPLTLQAAPFIEDGETWIPVRLFEKLGYTLTADPANGIVDLQSPVEGG
jgi:hypothetical protein